MGEVVPINQQQMVEKERVEVERQIRETFTPWYEDVHCLARLWRFLVVVKRRPVSPSHFLDHAEEWRDEYAAMLACDFPSLSEDA